MFVELDKKYEYNLNHEIFSEYVDRYWEEIGVIL